MDDKDGDCGGDRLRGETAGREGLVLPVDIDKRESFWFGSTSAAIDGTGA